MKNNKYNLFCGAYLGDSIGSVYEFDNIHTKEFPLFSSTSRPTDDTFMTYAIMLALEDWIQEGRPELDRLKEYCISHMQEVGRATLDGAYGTHFLSWLFQEHPEPYNSCGNGSAMRVSAVAYVSRTLEECIALSKAVTEISHNHPDGIMGAEATAVQIFLLRKGWKLEDVAAYQKAHYYPIDFTLDEIRPTYSWGSLCSNTCPEAFQCVYEAKDFEDAIRNAISLGGDSDTLGAIAGAIAEAAFGIPEELYERFQVSSAYQASLASAFHAFGERHQA